MLDKFHYKVEEGIFIPSPEVVFGGKAIADNGYAEILKKRGVEGLRFQVSGRLSYRSRRMLTAIWSLDFTPFSRGIWRGVYIFGLVLPEPAYRWLQYHRPTLAQVRKELSESQPKWVTNPYKLHPDIKYGLAFMTRLDWRRIVEEGEKDKLLRVESRTDLLPLWAKAHLRHKRLMRKLSEGNLVPMNQ